jgi:hypothetical protein
MSEKLTKLTKNISSGDWHSGMVNGTRFEITGGENSDKTIAFVFNEEDAEFISGCKTEVPKLIAEVERLRNGIDKVLYALTNEDISDVYVVEQIADVLRDVYKGETPKYFNHFYKEAN